MMKVRKKLIAALLSILATGPTFAQDFLVRSGEHDGFSRLAVDMPKRVPWALGDNGTRREIRFEDAPGNFQVDQVFDRLSEGRIAAVEVLPSNFGFVWEMTCNCDVDVSWHGPSMLVIDIIDVAEHQDEVSVPGLGPDVTHPLKPTERMEVAIPNSSTKTAEKLLISWIDTLNAPSSFEPAPVRDIVRQSIAQDMSRAATMGLLDINGNSSGFPKNDATEIKDLSDRGVEAEVVKVLESAQLNFSTLSASDLHPEIVPPEMAQTIAGMPCIDDELINIAIWGDATPFAHQIGALRAEAMDEFGQFLPGATLDLVRLYLYFGFGKEAAQIVEVSGLNGPAVEAALALVKIIEQEPVSSQMFSQQIECDTQASLWSALSLTEDVFTRTPNTDAILRTLSGYPAHLRSLIGPQLARAFASRGRDQDAERILRVLTQRSDIGTDAYFMAQAETLRMSRQPKSAAESYDSVVDGNGEYSAEALVDMIWTRLEAEEPLQPQIIDLVEGYSREHRGTALGEDLLNAQIAALAELHQFDQAFELSADKYSGVQVKIGSKTLEVLASNLGNDSSDLVFLRYVLSNGVMGWSGISSEASFVMAERLFKLGFYDDAQSYLNRIPEDEMYADPKLLEAGIHLAKANPAGALQSLSGVSGAEADMLRAKAHSLSGDHLGAHLAYISAGNTKEALREALLAEAWSNAGEVADPVMADLLAEDHPVDGTTEASQLQEGAQLLEESINAREKIGQLLSETLSAVADNLH